MYNHYYGFQEKPFSLTPDPHFLYLSKVHKRALAYLTYGLQDKKGFITITGEIGAGKTTIIQALINGLDTNTTVARVINTKVSSLQLLKMIVRDFGIENGADSKEDLLEKLNQFLLTQYSMGHNVVLIIDEAQNLEPPILEEIRLLSNLETEKDKLLQIILVGQPELREILRLPGLKQLRQRITVSYHLSALSSEEVGEYIKHRLAVAGLEERELFAQSAVQEVYNVSGGIPRLINIICDAALVTGYINECEQITGKLVKGVISELEMDAIECSPEPTDQKSAGAHPAGRNSIDAELRNREKRLADKQHELDVKQDELYEKLQQLLDLERELISREERIKNREIELGISITTKGM
jgi:putative secretion ATPase (PEP-CTERM system associated)